MEFFESRSGDPETVCDKEIKECDIFIGIYAHRYGYIPKLRKKSITQKEYEMAKKEGKDCLCFIVENSYPWPIKFVQMDNYRKLQAFLEKIKVENVVSFFESRDNFTAKLSGSLGILLAEQQSETASQKEYEYMIPFAPAPYIAHPYPLPDHFTGRDAERAMLSNWFHNEKQPVLVMEAIGGMGKSALSWVWLDKDIMGRSIEVEGIFWWSFYEEPFDCFIRQLACYVLRKEEKSLLSDDVTRVLGVLQHRRFLFVLDGLERVLRGYAGMEAMFIQETRFEDGADKEAESQWDQRLREPVHPLAARFLKGLPSCKTKTLITTRLMPAPLEGLAGVKHVFLKGLSEGDAVSFFRSEGVKGTRVELVQAGAVYDFHPLMLKLLNASIKRSRAKDIKEAFRLNLIDTKDPHKILIQSKKLLSKKEQKVASTVSVFRSAFTFEYAKALFPKMDEEELWDVMLELRNLGFLFYDEKEDRFDFHPILRAFLYNGLIDRAEIHIMAVQYFEALPKVEKVVTLDDLAPVIELYHHLVKAERFDEALYLFYDRINKPTYYRLSAYHLRIELLKELFPEGKDWLPRLKNEFDQAWTLNELANTYSLYGQPNKAVPLYLLQNKLHEKKPDKGNLGTGLENMAHMAQVQIGQLPASTVHLRKGIYLRREIEDEFWEAVGHAELGRVLAFQGRAIPTKGLNPPVGDSSFAEDELATAINIFKKHTTNYTSVCTSFFSICALLQAMLASALWGDEKRSSNHSLEALKQARQALAFAEETVKTRYPHPRDFVRAYWLVGEALIQCTLSSCEAKIKSFEIHFYDEPLQKEVETLRFKKGSELDMAEHCIDEALCRCRKINLVEFEPDILLAQARLERAKKRHSNVETLLKETMDIALRSGYRLKLADLHLFCGQVLLEDKKKDEKLLGFTAHEHLQKAKEYALDQSDISHLYQSPDPHFYDNIPEYEMLKRGMTEEERIQNGYFVVYKIAEALEKRGKG
jgi:hypothetical protein